MALNLADRRLIDPTGGRRDLEAGCLRMVSPQGFDADPLRLLRAYRLAATLGCVIEPETAAAIAARTKQIRSPAAERLRLELLKLLASHNAHAQLKQMAANGALTALLPELAPLRGCHQDPPHDGDVLEHSLRAAGCLERWLTKTAGPAWPAHCLPAARVPLLKLAVLLHDIGKPAMRSRDVDGRVHFFGHARRGAQWAERRCLRLRLSKRESEYVAFIVARHMYPFELFAAHRRRRLGTRALTRFCMRCGRYTPDLLIHALADVYAKAHARPEAFDAFAGTLRNHYQQHFQPASGLSPLINGHDLMRIFGLDPSPLFKKLLASVRTAQLAGEVSSRSEALDRVRMLLGRRGATDVPSPAEDDGGTVPAPKKDPGP
jgi:putative nucleotidyltransferase with HDIG domain